MRVKEFKINVPFGDCVDIYIDDFLYRTHDYKYKGGGEQHNLSQEDYDMIEENLRAISDSVMEIVNKLKDKEEVRPPKEDVEFYCVPDGFVKTNFIKIKEVYYPVLAGEDYAEEVFEKYVEPRMKFGKNVLNIIQFNNNVRRVNSHFSARFAECLDQYNKDSNRYGYAYVQGKKQIQNPINGKLKYTKENEYGK